MDSLTFHNLDYLGATLDLEVESDNVKVTPVSVGEFPLVLEHSNGSVTVDLVEGRALCG